MPIELRHLESDFPEEEEEGAEGDADQVVDEEGEEEGGTVLGMQFQPSSLASNLFHSFFGGSLKQSASLDEEDPGGAGRKARYEYESPKLRSGSEQASASLTQVNRGDRRPSRASAFPAGSCLHLRRGFAETATAPAAPSHPGGGARHDGRRRRRWPESGGIPHQRVLGQEQPQRAIGQRGRPQAEVQVNGDFS